MTEKNVVGAGRKDDEFPTFKSDIMDEEEDKIKAVSATNPITPVSAINVAVSSIDAVEKWREMSEKQKKIRLTNSKTHAQIKQTKPQNNFQKEYEQDSINIPSYEKHEESFLSELYRKIQTANTKLDSNSLIKLEPKEENKKQKKIDIGNLKDIKVSDVMTTNVICVIDSTTIEQVASIFNIHNIRGVPVIDYQTKKLLGSITLKEIFSNTFKEKVVSTLNINQDSFYNFDENILKQHTLSILEKPVKNFMKKAITVSADTKITDACKFMFENKVRRVIVTEDDIVKGIFSAFDAVKILANYD